MPFWQNKKKDKDNNISGDKQLVLDTNNGAQISNNLENATYNLEEKLEDILSKIEGVR